MPHRSKLALATALALTALLGTACTTDGGTDAGAVVPPAQPRADLTLAPAEGDPVLRLTGLVGTGRPLDVDLLSLDGLPQQSVTTYEPFLKTTVTFSGVAFADLLDAAGASGQDVLVHALDDYERTIPANALREPGVLLATREGGEEIPIPEGGPVRLVFPEDSPTGADPDLWVWSVDRISVS
jgi:hypothetical protein